MAVVETDIPARLDRLPWSPWHWRVVVALGVTWILDGLEVTVVGAIGGALEAKDALGLSPAEIGLAGSAYVAGAIAGALAFGRAADRMGRKRLFLVTLWLYVAATLLTSLAWSFTSFAAFRLLTGAAIGGEYAAINSAIDELLPARVRGHADLAINGSYWIGTAAGAAASTVLLDRRWFPPWLGWRLAFALGAVLSGAIVLVRRHVPESPRWLLLRGRVDEADAIVGEAEEEAFRGAVPPRSDLPRLRVVVGRQPSFADVARVIFVRHRSRAVLGLALMLAQAFFYNAIFFTYALTLTRFYAVAPERVGFYLLPFAAGNFLGPLVLGRLFDTIGRRSMIAGTYAGSGILLLASGVLFVRGSLDATTQALAWSAVFFVASAAASSAYLTVSEIFPVEIRAAAIALFYAVGTGAGGVAAPALFGALVSTGDRREVFGGYCLGASLMVVAALVAWVLGVPAERQPLESVAEPLSAVSNSD